MTLLEHIQNYENRKKEICKHVNFSQFKQSRKSRPGVNLEALRTELATEMRDTSYLDIVVTDGKVYFDRNHSQQATHLLNCVAKQAVVTTYKLENGRHMAVIG